MTKVFVFFWQRMPRSFVSEHWDERISNPVMLLLPAAAEWKVIWEKRGHDVIMCGDQWKKFQGFYSLDVNHYLRFSFKYDSHDQRSKFEVEIHDDGLEINYPFREGTPEESSGDEETDKNKRAKSPLPFSAPPNKKLKTNTKEGKKSKHAGTESQRVKINLENATIPKNTGRFFSLCYFLYL